MEIRQAECLSVVSTGSVEGYKKVDGEGQFVCIAQHVFPNSTAMLQLIGQ
jgi:hypothetical protein